MIMSSFLMNPVSGTLPSSYQQAQHISAGVVVDPKFPPTEEYSQNSYIPSPTENFFGNHHLTQPQHHLQYGYHNHHQAASYGSAGVPLTNSGYGYGNYYHPQLHHAPPLHSHQIRPPIQIHDSQQPLVNCGSLPNSHPQPPVTSSSNILQNLADISPNVSQPSDVNSSVCSPVSVGHGQESRGSPPGGHPQGHSLQELGLRLEDSVSDEPDDIDDHGSSTNNDEDDDDDENGDRQIYPWMKKVHVAGACRRAVNQMVQILTGHCRLRSHLHLIGIESPLCPECGVGEDTPVHLLGSCIAFGRLRDKVFRTGVLQREETRDLPWTKVLLAVQRGL
ncbi:hypothetical protein NQ315_008352 [Exocentrus adspersus]|uniref:Uncharacterized protein n=1 Tax=Exocentrus adspersus TaxID=1586481 RepID=A0AAV8VRK9_9CUCU|nr:hypothetical protein NQ315_008352 [Exocentrus adspersus]